MAKIYASQFTEQELKDLITFYKIAARPELLSEEPKAVDREHAWQSGPVGAEFREVVNGQFRAEMRKRGKQI